MAQIFEFIFNPKNKENIIFDSFCFEPTNVYEKRMGSLYLIGVLKNSLPQNNRFLTILAEKIKQEYYKAVSITPEKSLKTSLKTANDHLEKQAKKGDVSWLGNLSFATISLKNFELNYTKVGELKILLIRNEQIIDIDQKVNFDELEPYPLKVFGNIISGKLTENDVLLILSKQAYDLFLKENIFNEICQKSIKKIKNILNSKNQELLKISGLCLAISLTKEKFSQEKDVLIEKKSLKIFSLKQVFLPLVQKIKRPKLTLPRINLPKPKLIKINLTKKTKLKKKKPVLGKINLSEKLSFNKPSENFKKNIVLVLILIFFFLLGSYIFERKEQSQIDNYQNQINEIEQKINQADNYLSLINDPQAQKTANQLYLEAWNNVSSLIKISVKLPLKIEEQVSELKLSLLEKLEQLNKLTKITEPELVFEFKTREFIPRRFVFFNNNFYFFTPLSNNIFRITENQAEQRFDTELFETNQKINLAVPLTDSILFFSKPNQIKVFKENQLIETINLEKPSTDFDYISFNSYYSHLYFLDSVNNLILKYPFKSDLTWQMPETWLAPEVKIAVNFKSMTIDSSIWLLTERNSVQRYFNGRLTETINLEVFPEAKNFSRIFTSLNHQYIYLLEPAEKRIIIIDKQGEIIKQFQSDKFDNLLDFSVSSDGQTIYLLNGMKLFKIKTN
jgi:hypothetical protein